MRRLHFSVDVKANGEGEFRTEVRGIITNVYRTYNGQSATVDGVLFEQYPNAERTLLTVSNSNINGNSTVLVNGVDSANAPLSGAYVNPSVAGELVLRVTGGTQKTAGVVWYVTIIDVP